MIRRSFQTISQTFFRGLIAILPIAATLYVIVWLAQKAESILRSPFGTAIDGFRFYFPGLGIVVALGAIFLLGLVINAWIVQQFLGAFEHLLQRIPVAKTVMGSVRDLLGFFAKSDKGQMSHVVVVALGADAPAALLAGLPAPGGNGQPGAAHEPAADSLRLIGFVTRNDLTDLPPAAGGDAFVAVYFPFSYALGGMTMLVPRSRLRSLDLSVEEAMRFVLTAGMKAKGRNVPHPEALNSLSP